MSNPSIILATLLSLVALSGCSVSRLLSAQTTHKPYRLGAAAVETIPKNTPKSKIRLGYLEFDDQGEPWRERDGNGKITGKSQLTRVLEALEQEMQKGPTKVVVFVHGWNHNASPENWHKGNLFNFREALAKLKPSGSERMFGIYMGWRGKSYPFTTGVDVLSREAAAGRVGGAPLLHALQAISAKVHSRERSRLIAVGHSFGAKILAQVTAHSLASQMGEIRGGGQKSVRPLADTIVLVNTAEKAMIPRQLMSIFRDHPVSYVSPHNGRKLPLMVVVTSKTDYLTIGGIPVFNFFTRNIIGLPGKGGSTSSRGQRKAMNLAMGFDPALNSHLLKATTEKHACLDPHINNPAALAKENIKYGAEDPRGRNFVMKALLFPKKTQSEPLVYELREDQDSALEKNVDWNNTPFWAVKVPPSVVHGHGDIWNPNFVGLVLGLDAMSHPPSNPEKMGEAPRMRLLKKSR